MRVCDVVNIQTRTRSQRPKEVTAVGVRVREGEPFERALRLRRQVERAGILKEVRRRTHYEKPSVRKKKKALAARKRLLKKLRRQQRGR